MAIGPTRAQSTVADLVADLRRLGVKAGDLVMVHASLRAIGPVEGRAEGVVQALDAAVSPGGTVLMMIGAEDDWSWVNERPEADRPALLAEAEPFDAAVTPAQEDIGTLAEIFRHQPRTLVSDHPEGRFAARGPLAAELVADVPWDDYYGVGSPLEQLVERGGKVLRLGADIDTVTLTHYAENLVDLPDKVRVRRCRRVLGPDGPEIRWVDALDDTYGIASWSGGDYFPQILVDFFAAGSATHGQVGNAASDLFDAAPFVTHSVRWMAEHLSEAAS